MDPKFNFFIVKAIDTEKRTVDATASTGDLDRDNERILPSAFNDIDSFKSNPVILATHQHRLPSGSSPVIGSAIPESISIGANEVTFKMHFAETPLGEEYWKLYKDKHMRAFSIGFIPLEWKDDKDVRTYTKIELLEISAVPVPSNRRALARAKGFFDNEDNKETIAAAIKEQFDDLKQSIEQQLDDIKSMIIANPNELADSLLSGNSELSAPGGDTIKNAEHHLNRIKKAFGKVD
ncbi:MAG: HK97 family phage prohead protease [Sedimentisphaerales bacterium]|jgi:HK97 family phage prohead protease